MSTQAFVSSVPLTSQSFRTRPQLALSRPSQTFFSPATLTPRARPHRRHAPATMLQSPTGDGPPDLSALEDSQMTTGGLAGPPVRLGTYRAVIGKDGDDARAAGSAAAKAALVALEGGEAALAHVTVGADVPLADAVAGVADAVGPGLPVLARGAPRRDSAGMVEVLVLGGRSGAGAGSAPVTGGDVAGAAAAAAKQAVGDALSALGANKDDPSTWPAFGVFVSSPGGEDGARQGMGGGVPVYGGEAVTLEAGAPAGAGIPGKGVLMTDGAERQDVGVVLLAGQTSFLVSAVVKAWAQPAYVEKLPFLIPDYSGSNKEDLLTAIRYDDYDKFVDCLEGEDPTDVNVKWETRQHQSPLLASVARGRLRMVDYLLGRGADVTYRNDGGFNAIMYAGMLKDTGNEELVKLLLDAGADPNDTAVIKRDPGTS